METSVSGVKTKFQKLKIFWKTYVYPKSEPETLTSLFWDTVTVNSIINGKTLTKYVWLDRIFYKIKESKMLTR